MEEISLKGDKGRINVKALIDTGAERTVIPLKLAKEIGANPLGQTIKLVGFNGSVQECELYSLKIGFPRLKKEPIGLLAVAACDAVRHPIIGMDLMGMLGIVPDPKTKTIYIKSETWEVIKTLLALIGGIALLGLLFSEKQ